MNNFYPTYYPQGYYGIPSNQQRMQELERGMNNQVPRPSFKAIPVMSFDEAKAAMVDFDGSLNLFVDIQNNQIYTKQLNMNGLAELKVYKLVTEPQPIPPMVQYVPKEDFDVLMNEVKSLKGRLDELGG